MSASGSTTRVNETRELDGKKAKLPFSIYFPHLLKGSQNILYLLQKSLSNAFQLHISQHPVENIQIAFDDLISDIII